MISETMEYHLSNDTTLVPFELVSKNYMLVYLHFQEVGDFQMDCFLKDVSMFSSIFRSMLRRKKINWHVSHPSYLNNPSDKEVKRISNLIFFLLNGYENIDKIVFH